MADNEHLELKKRARRRLVGASALALLAAIVLPMVMEHEPRQAGQDIQVRIPSQEGANYAARVIRGQDAAPPKPALPAPASVPVEPLAQASAPVAAVSGPIVPPPSHSEKTERDQREAAKAQERKLSAANEAQAAVKELARREQEQAKREAQRKENEARKEEARAEEAKAQRAGDSSREKGGDASRAAAILNGETPSAAKASSPARTGSGHFVIQLGSFKDSANASSLKSRAAAEGVGAYVESAGDKTRVRAGPYPSREAAEAAANRLRKAGLPASVAPAS